MTIAGPQHHTVVAERHGIGVAVSSYVLNRKKTHNVAADASRRSSNSYVNPMRSAVIH